MSNKSWNYTIKIGMTILLLGSLILTPTAQADEATENLPLFSSDIVNKEIRNRNDYYFEVNTARQVLDGSYLELFISHSSMLNPKQSVITVLLDDVPLDSKYLDESNVDRTSYRVDLSKHITKSGFHNVSIVSNLVARGNVCDDLNNPGNWMIIHKDSVVHLNVANINNTPDLKWYPNPFIEKGSLTPLNTIFVVPDAMNTAELQVLGKLSGFFAKQVPDSRLNFTVYVESDVTDDLLAGRHSVWMGHKGGWKDKGIKVSDEASKLVTDPAKGYIALAPSPWNSTKSVLMLEADEKTIGRGGDLLTEPTFYSQLQGAGIQIPDTIKLPNPSPQPLNASGNKVTFEQLGYPDMVMENAAIGNTHIEYTFPSEWEVDDELKLKLLYRHSKALNFAESVLTVSANNTPLASKFLSAESSDTGILELTIPKDTIAGKSSLALDISFQLWTTKDRDTCAEASPHLGEWAIIDKTSFLTVPFHDRQNYQLSNLPAPFIKGGKWDSTTFVLPEHPTSKELSLFAAVRSAMGKMASTDEEATITLTSANLKSEVTDRNMIVIGGVETISPLFWEGGTIPFRMNGKTIVPTMSDVQLLPQVQNQAAILSLSPAPFNKSKSLLLYTSIERNGISEWNEILRNPEQDGKLKGTFALVDSIGRVHTFEAKTEPKKPGFFSHLGDKLSLEGHPLLFRFAISILFVAVVAVIGIALWKMKKRKKGQKGH
ncbi:cellulose biosynthesis cyclic di-GMP-binding regulatory protein BcsB [Paenibacillus sp. KN14-4R]|uniref:cellulose biosynthesis cyclic di-GMP-binding regulatory protein BcsB n=1 Tax=Paenibacillus sp. KN14-4R TaxID=3445773 RepID=UPI003FA11189